MSRGQFPAPHDAGLNAIAGASASSVTTGPSILISSLSLNYKVRRS